MNQPDNSTTLQVNSTGNEIAVNSILENLTNNVATSTEVALINTTPEQQVELANLLGLPEEKTPI